MTEKPQTTANAKTDMLPVADGCMWCRYGDHPTGPVCPIHQAGREPSDADYWDAIYDLDRGGRSPTGRPGCSASSASSVAMTDFLQCPSCKGIGRLAVTYGRDIAAVERCDECDGRGVRLCCETRCAEPAVSELLERGESYPLCGAHLIRWLEDMNV